MSMISEFRKQTQEDAHEFEASLGNIAKVYVNKPR